MKTSYIVGLVAVILLAGGVWWYMSQDDSEGGAEQVVTEFMNTETEETIQVTFDNTTKTATLMGLGFEGLVFNEAMAASGARYENEEELLVLWNKGNEVTVYGASDEIIFTGVTAPTE